MTEINKKFKKSTNGPIIILVEPQLPENIGMVARAMANFGLKKLRLVNPRERFPHEKAISTASKATHILEDAKLYFSLAEATSDLNFLFATTARSRDLFKIVENDPSKAALSLYEKEIDFQKTGILFGRERWGLTNEEISLADEIITFPVDPEFSSLNIAQAVLLMSYEFHKICKEKDKWSLKKTLEKIQIPATKEELYHFFEHLEEALYVRGYFRPLERRNVMSYNLRSIFTKFSLSKQELQLLRGIISSLEKFSPHLPKGRKTEQNLENQKTKE